MIQTAFSAFLASLLSIPAVFLVGVRSKTLRVATSALMLVALAAGAVVGGMGFWHGARLAVDFSQVSPLPFALGLDRLSAFFLLLICAISVPVTLFSSSYVERHYQGWGRALLWALLPLFIGSMVVVVTASTAFAFLFGW